MGLSESEDPGEASQFVFNTVKSVRVAAKFGVTLLKCPRHDHGHKVLPLSVRHTQQHQLSKSNSLIRIL